jgi:SAM-dependent methyltransferase
MRVYGRLAEVLVDVAGVELAGCAVLDVGAGTGAATRAAATRGGRVVAVDVAEGMLRFEREARPSAVVGDLLALPFAPSSFDVAVAAFALNHFADPAVGTREVARVVRPGGHVVASTYAVDDAHPVREAVQRALVEAGWAPPPWYAETRVAMAAWGTPPAAAEVLGSAGLVHARAEQVRVPFAELEAVDLVEWRLGMAHTAPFADALDAEHRRDLVARALALLGDGHEPLVRSMIVAVGEVAGPSPPVTRRGGARSGG